MPVQRRSFHRPIIMYGSIMQRIHRYPLQAIVSVCSTTCATCWLKTQNSLSEACTAGSTSGSCKTRGMFGSGQLLHVMHGKTKLSILYARALPTFFTILMGETVFSQTCKAYHPGHRRLQRAQPLLLPPVSGCSTCAGSNKYRAISSISIHT